MNTVVARAAVAAALTLVMLTGCAAAPGSRPPSSSPDAGGGQILGASAPELPSSEVVGAGTVIDEGGDAKLCLHAIMESYPPQCDGVPLDAWGWDGLEGFESSGTTRWGSYAVTGTYDGKRLTVTQVPVLLALYDPPPIDDPADREPGTATEDEVLAIQEDLAMRDIEGLLGVGSFSEGRVTVVVAWDDGTLQQAADDEFGEGVVVVSSALREID